MAALTFLGGTGSVTGSKFLVEHAGHRVLVDCGLYQGLRELRALNWEPLPIDPSTIDAVVITHAHLDHSGYLPRLARQGFAGPVVCTRDTAALATIVLRDSAYLQEEEAAYARRAGFSKHSPPLPLYASDDAERVIGLLRHVDFGSAQPLADDIDVELNPAGHILGSATALLDVGGRRVLFSGDLGRPSHPLLAPPAPPPPADVIVVESTYGDRGHGAPDTALLASAVRRTVRRGGVVLVAAFAVDRTEVVLAALARLRREGAIPAVPVYVDSPMALSAIEVYRRALREGRPDLRPRVRDPLGSDDFIAAPTVLASQQLNAPDGPCIVVSASGMLSGGRIVHHLKH